MIALIVINCALLIINILVLIIIATAIILMNDGHDWKWNSGDGCVFDNSIKGRTKHAGN